MEFNYRSVDQNMDRKVPRDVSAIELRKVIRFELHKSGAVDALTAQFRYHVLNSLVFHKEYKSKSEAICLNDVLLRSIIVDFLKKHGMVQTIAVFIPESNMQEKVLSQDDMFRIIETNSESNASNLLANNSNSSVLVTLVSRATRAKSTTHGTQTDECNATMNARYDLNFELSRSHEKYDQALKENLLNSTKNIDRVMKAFQLECDARYKQEHERNLHRFKENLLHAMQQEELHKYQKELQSMRESFRADFDSRLQKELDEIRRVHHLEIKNMKNNMDGNKKEMEEIMKMMEISRREHIEEQRSLKAQKISLEKEEKRINDLLKEANTKLKDVENKEIDMKQKVALEYDVARKEAKLAYDDATEVLHSQRDCYIEEMKCFEGMEYA